MLIDTENTMREKFNALLTESEENARKNRIEQESKHKEDVSALTTARVTLEESHNASRREFENEISFYVLFTCIIALLTDVRYARNTRR